MFSTVPIPRVVREHLDNAAELAAKIRTANERREPRAWLSQVCRRCEDNLEGLRLVRQYSIDLAYESMSDDPEIASVLAILLAELAFEDPTAADKAVDLLQSHSSDIREWAWWGLRLAPLCNALTESLRSLSLDSAYDILAFHRQPMPIGHKSQSDSLWFLLEAIGRSDTPWAPSQLEEFLSHPDPAVRYAALRASARRHLPELLDICRSHAESPEALEFLGIIGSEKELPLFQRALADKETGHAALNALGRLGLPQSMPSILDSLKVSSHAETAASSFERITGQPVIRRPLQDLPTHLSEDELDTRDTRGPIDLAATRRLWQSLSAKFTFESRWQSGLSISHAPLSDGIFERLPLQSGYDIYLRERAFHPHTPDWELETWIWNQKTPSCTIQGTVCQ